jgi:hypothetical protein
VRAATCGGPTGVSYYVSPSGSDTNPCSVANPCREIREALTLVHPGDIVHVADGQYLGGGNQVYIPNVPAGWSTLQPW